MVDDLPALGADVQEAVLLEQPGIVIGHLKRVVALPAPQPQPSARSCPPVVPVVVVVAVVVVVVIVPTTVVFVVAVARMSRGFARRHTLSHTHTHTQSLYADTQQRGAAAALCCCAIHTPSSHAQKCLLGPRARSLRCTLCSSRSLCLSLSTLSLSLARGAPTSMISSPVFLVDVANVYCLCARARAYRASANARTHQHSSFLFLFPIAIQLSLVSSSLSLAPSPSLLFSLSRSRLYRSSHPTRERSWLSSTSSAPAAAEYRDEKHHGARLFLGARHL